MEKITKEKLLENLGGTPLSDDELDNVSGGGYGGICTERGCTLVSENTCYYPTPCSKLCIGPQGDCTCSNGIRGTFLKLLF